MTTFLSGEPKMHEAYNNGKDLYAIIAQAAFHNNYEDNLEFYPAGTEIEIDGQKVICGNKTHLNKAGKERRSTGKVLNLSCTYGMSARTAGIRLGYDVKHAAEEGGKLLNNFFTGFPGVKTAIDNSKEFLKNYGYVEDFLGRRRRLEDINLEPYEAKLKIPTIVSARFNPFLICKDRQDLNDAETVWDIILKAYGIMATAQHIIQNKPYEAGSMSSKTFDWLKKVANAPATMLDTKYSTNQYSKTNREKILNDLTTTFKGIIDDHRYVGRIYRDKIEAALNDEYGDYKNADLRRLVNQYVSKYGHYIPTTIPNDPMNLFAWTGRIAQASRQCFNARIQGSAASLTKLAMVDIFNDTIMNQCKAKLIIPVHDELLVECPEEYADIVEKRLPEIMINAAKRGGDDVPQSCDPYNVTRWYSDTAGAFIQEEFKKLENGNKDKGIAPLSRDEALEKVIQNHTEVPREAIVKTIETGCDLEF